MSENKIIRFEEFRDYLLSWPQGGKKCAVCENNLFTLRVTLNTTLGGRDAGTDVGVAYSIPFAALEPIKAEESPEKKTGIEFCDLLIALTNSMRSPLCLPVKYARLFSVML